MTADDWNTSWAKAIGMFLDGSGSEEPDEDFYIAFNAHCEPVEFTIPPELGDAWRVLIYTADAAAGHVRLSKRNAFYVEAYSLLVIARA